MLARAHAKASAAQVSVGLVRGDAAAVPFRPASFDAVVVRHLLWAISDVDRALRDWSGLLRPGGALLLIEGRWSTGGGLSAVEVVGALRRTGGRAAVHELTDQRLWGRGVDDERYLVVSRF
jgi:SAM-dependent methyltransferase